MPESVEDKEGPVELEGLVDLETVRSTLRRRLPEHMVPSGFVGIARVPLTSSGKVDHNALPDTDVSVPRTVYAAPRTDEERAVADVMADLLDAKGVGLHDSFFDLGGHSLLAVRLVARLAEATGRDLPLRVVFEQPTVKGLAAALGELEVGSADRIPVADRSLPLPLSWQQERLWFLDRLDARAGAAYHIEGAVRLKGALDADALKAALSSVVERHESLRTHFADAEGHPVQVIAPCKGFTVGEEDLTGLDEPAIGRRVDTLLSRRFDLSAGPLFRATLLRVGEVEYILVVGGHHAVLDGWSLDLLLGEVAAFYSAHVAGDAVIPEPLAVQYGDYASWQRTVLDVHHLEEKAAHWKQQLAGVPDAIALPFDRPRPKQADYRGGQVEMQVPSDVAARLNAVARSCDATLFMVLETAFAVLLYRLGGDEDLMIGTAVGGRPRLELERLIGFFVNTVPLRHRFESGETYEDCLGRHRSMILDAFEHSEVPFEAVVEAVQPTRSLSHQPLVQVMFVLQNTGDAGGRDLDAAFEGLEVEVLGDDGRSDGQFELSLSLEERADGIGGSLSYATQLFDAATARRVATMYERVLTAIADDPRTVLAQLPLMSEDERRELITGFNQTAVDYPADGTVVDLFEEQVVAQPEAVAVIDGDRDLTYGDLDAMSNRLARHLINQGIGPECVVGVCLERGQDLIVALLAIWKAGAAYLPLDPDYPRDRLAFMLDDSGANVVVTATDFQKMLPECGVQLVLTDDDETVAVVAALPSIAIVDAERMAPLTPNNLAYAIYTSGSTGKPKGVMVEHGDLAHYASFSNDAFGRLERETVLHRTTIGFDYSAEELWWPLAFGHRVVVAPEAISSNPAALCRLCAERGVTTMIVVPSVLSVLLSHGGLDQCTALQQILCGGEALDNRLEQKLLEQTDRIRLINHYGPTEATINATWHDCANGADDNGPVASIGSPVANTQIYVVDDRLEPTPMGVAGELMIGGVQVGRGYLGRSGLTADRFIADPFGSAPGARLYRTGDLARWRSDGTLEFLGRGDFQVKIRGMRVELGEIEAGLAACDGIAQAVVVARRDADGDTRLVAYVVPDGVEDKEGSFELEGVVNLEALRGALRRSLPEHMVPTGFVGIARVPLTSSGKVDRKVLPDADVSGQRAAYAAPRSEEERAVAEAMADLLDAETVGLHDGFFDLGGHSLLAVRLVTRLAKVTGRDLPLRAVFEQPTVQGLAAVLAELGAGGVDAIPMADRSAPLPLSWQQERLWFLDRLDTQAGAAYHIEGALRLKGALDADALKTALSLVVERHESLRTHFAEADGRPVQIIVDSNAFTVVEEDVSGLDETSLRQRVETLLSRPFDLSAGPLFRATLLSAGDADFILVAGGHHTVLDGWSLDLLLVEVANFYSAHVTDGATMLEPLAVQYGDYAAWQRTMLGPDRLDEKTAYWREQLAGVPDAITLSSDRPRPKQADYRGGQVEVQVPGDVTARLDAVARSCDATLFMVLETAFAVLLHRLGGDEDLVIGTAVGGRPRLELERLIGFFANTVPLRHRFESGETFEDCLGRNRQTIVDAFEHSDVPFEAVVEAVRPVRSLSHQPLVQVMFVLQNTGDAGGRDLDAAFEGLEVEVLGDDGRSDGQFELSLSLEERADGIGGSLSYARQLFDAATARRIATMYERVLTAIADDPRTVLAQLPLMSEDERRELITGFNQTAVDYPADGTVVDLFEEQVVAQPEAVAVIDGDRDLTYGDLDAMSNRLARHLINQGIGPECVVGVCLERGQDLIVALLAIWKAGAAYLPLDPDYPRDRLAFMLDDSGANVVVTATDFQDVLPEGEVQVVLTDDDETDAVVAALPSIAIVDAERMAPLTPNNLAYAIYTSGSTGKPKGVMVEHSDLAHYASFSNDAFGRLERETVLHRTTIGFDYSAEELWWPLAFGHRVVVAPEAISSNPAALCRLCAERGVTTMIVVPSVLSVLLSHGGLDQCTALQQILCGGEALDNRLKQNLLEQIDRIRLINHYGPTEATINATWHDCTNGADHDGPVASIGSPVANTQIYVVDDRLEPTPLGVAGELLIGGVQVGRGYLGRSGLMADRFIADPFGSAPGARLYRTGDLARWRSDGTLEFLGRGDFQVKIRGMRVELGEIEARLTACDGIAQAVVVARTDAGGDARLIAYVAPEGVDDGQGPVELEGLLDLEAVRNALRCKLPEHMVPSGFVGIARVPRTSSGKVDRKALPDVDVSVQRADYAAPRSEEERAVAEAMADLLEVEEAVGLHDSFFDLGGHSLLAVRLVARLTEATGRDLPVRAVFERPTVEELAAALADLQAGEVEAIPLADRSTALPLSWQQERLWFLDRLDRKAGAAYHIEGALHLKGALDADALKVALSAVVDRHESLRTHFAEADGHPVLVIAPCEGFAVGEEDLMGFDQPAIEQRVDTLLSRPFDLSSGPLFRATLLRIGETEHILVAGGHHSVLDGWSLDLLLGEVAAFYSAHVSGEANEPEPLAVQYGDYAAWQRTLLDANRLGEKAAYWKQQLAGVPDAVTLPFDRPRPTQADYRSDQVEVQVPEDVVARLNTLARSCDATLFMVLETAFAVLLYRIGGDEDLVIGTAVGGRPRLELERLVGFFVNTVALRHRFGSGETFEDCLGRNRQTIVDAFEHSDVPFEAVVEAVQPTRSLSHQPLVQVMFVLQNTGDAGGRQLDAAFEGLEVDVLGDDGRSDGQFELSLSLEKGADGIGGSLSYATQLFDAATARRIAAMYERMLTAIADDPLTVLAQLPLMSEDERRELITGFNQTAADYPEDKTVVDLFDEQAAARPEAVAVIDGVRNLTYGDLDAESNRLARHLIDQGVGCEHVVGVCMERSAELIVSLLAIWKSGASYLPLDPDHPRDRLAFMLNDAKARVAITARGYEDTLPADVRAIPLDDEGVAETISALSEVAIRDADRRSPLTPDTLAYVIYTSGSTGKPKGVMGNQKNLVHLSLGYIEAVGIEAGRRGLQRVSATWVTFLEEVLPMLVSGGTLAIYREKGRFEADRFWQFVCDRNIDYVVTLPSIVGTAPDRFDFSNRSLVVTGERPRWSDLRIPVGSARVWNSWGSTETAAVAGISDVICDARDAFALAPFGRAKVYVLDPALNIVPVSVPGELFVGGDAAALGYLGRPGLTADKFVADPFGSAPGARLYRTGDLARWRPDGTLEFLGRADFQIKIRGMRVELGEIEAGLMACAGIAQAVVVAYTAASDDTRLIAYVVPDGAEAKEGSFQLEGLLDLEAVRGELRRSLPGHIVPSGFVGIARVPLTSSGKVDRKALPDVDVTMQRTAYAAPRSDEEKAVAAAVADLLDVDEAVGLHDSFFDLGGHSLLAVRLAARLAEMTGRQLPLRAVFEQPTVAGLAAALSAGTDRQAGTVVPATRSGILPLSSVEERALTDGQYRAHVGDEEIQNFLIRKVIALEGPFNPSLIERTLAALVDRHEILRTHYEPGPENGGFHPVIGEKGSFRLRVHTLTGCDRKDALQLVLEDVSKPPPVNVFEGPMVCASLFVVSEDLAFLTLCFFHISVDAVSIALLAGEFAQIYAALAEQTDPDLDDPAMQYVDFSAWERKELTPERVKTLKRYWTDKLSEAPVFLERLYDRPLPETQSDRGGYVHRQMNASVVQAVRQLAGYGDATHFVVLETSLAIVFSRLTNVEDIVIGTLTSGRRHPVFENCIGNFVNNILLRHRISPTDTIVMSLGAALADLASSLENDLLPFAEVAASITNGHNGTFRPAYEVFCQLIIEEEPDGVQPGSLEFTDIDITKPQPPQGEDLAITFIQSGDEIEARVGFLADQFDDSTIEALIDLYSAFVVQSAKSPDRSIDAVWRRCVEAMPDDNRSAALQRLLSRSQRAGRNPSGDTGVSLSPH